MPEVSESPQLDPATRRAARRRYAAVALVLALILLGGWYALLESGSRTLGEAAIGYGIGVLVAAGFLAAGWEPKSRR